MLIIVLSTFKINDWNLYSSGVGILGKLVGFLTILGVEFPPIDGIMIAEYFFVKKWRNNLESTKGDEFPATAPRFVPVTLIIWAVSSMGAYFVTWGIPSINALASAFLPYLIADKLKLIRGYGTQQNNTSENTDTSTHHLEGQV